MTDTRLPLTVLSCICGPRRVAGDGRLNPATDRGQRKAA